MKFNDKLIDLRKKSGMSQEDLGNKLNVTRQTVSKWELGQTTPEMDKIKEISNLFNVSVDYLLKEDNAIQEKIEPKKEEKKGREKIVLGILVFILIICIGGILYFIITGAKENKNNFFDDFNDTREEIEENLDNFKDDFEQTNLEFFYKGTISGSLTKEAIEEIISLNSKGNNISVLIGETEYKPEEVEKIKPMIKINSSYNFKYEYENNKIVKVIIKRELSELEIRNHNSKLEFLYTGTKYGTQLDSLFDEIIKINKDEERKVVLNFLGKNYTDTSEIRKLKTSLKDFTEYEVYHEYDTDGFINKTIVEEVK